MFIVWVFLLGCLVGAGFSLALEQNRESLTELAARKGVQIHGEFRVELENGTNLMMEERSITNVDAALVRLREYLDGLKDIKEDR